MPETQIALILPLDKATKSEIDGSHPSHHYLYVPDPEKPSTWKLPVRTPAGQIDHNRLGAAWAALHKGYRGNKASLPDAAHSAAISKLRAAYREAGKEPPDERDSELKKSLEAKMMKDRYAMEFLRKDFRQGTENMDMSLSAKAAEMQADHDQNMHMKHASHRKMMDDREASHQHEMDNDYADHQKNLANLNKGLPEGMDSEAAKAARVDHDYDRRNKQAVHEHGSRLLDSQHQHEMAQAHSEFLRKCGSMQMSIPARGYSSNTATDTGGYSSMYDR